MTKQRLILLLAAMILVSGAVQARGAKVSDEARRHFDRGMAAVEMAGTAEDYDLAISEFQRARDLAPEWPDVHYNLGLVQDKAGRYADAVASLRRYVQLAPNAADADAIRSLANRDEFKAEQVLDEDTIWRILASVTDTKVWKLTGVRNTYLLRTDWMRSIRKGTNYKGQERLMYQFASGTCCPTNHGICDMDSLPTGKSVELHTWYCACQDGGCGTFYTYRLEVVSRNKVRMDVEAAIAKELGGGTDSASFEFIRR